MTRALDLLRKHHVRAVPYGPGRVKLQSERATVIQSRIDEAAMKAAFIISTPTEDRQGEVVLPRGCVPTLATYVANPVVHLNHRTSDHPIALSETYHGAPGIDLFDERLEGVAAFHGKTELSAQTWELTLLGVYKGASIGFRPLLAQREEVESDPRDLMSSEGEVEFGRKGYRLVFRRWELVEWSVTGVPCNPDAVVPLAYRELVTRTLQKGLDGGRPVLPTLRDDLSAFVLPRRSWPTVTKGDSYFSDCERDDQGHCLPSGQAGEGGEGKPAAAEGEEGEQPASYKEAEEAWKEETARLKQEHEAAREAWQAETERLQDEYDEAHDAWEEETQRLESEYEEAHGAWEKRDADRGEQIATLNDTDHVGDLSDDLQNGLNDAGAGIGDNSFYSVKPDQRDGYRAGLEAYAEAIPGVFDAHLGADSPLAETLTGLGVTEKEYARVTAAVEKGKEAMQKSVAKWQEAFEAHVAFLEELEAHDAAEPKEPPEPDEAAHNAKEPDPEDEEAYAAWEADWDRQVDDHAAAHESWESDHEAWEAKQEKLQEKEATLSEKVDNAGEATDTLLSDTLDKVSEKVQAVAGLAAARLEKEGEKDEEPDAPDLPDEPDEPDMPDEPDAPDYPDRPERDDFDEDEEGEEEKRYKSSFFAECPRDAQGHCLPGSGGGGGGGSGGGASTSAAPKIEESALPEKARSRLGKLRDALASAGSAVAHPSRTAKKAVAAARAKLKAMHKKYGTTGTALILGAAVVATPIPVPGATPVAVWAVSKLLSVLGMAKPDEKSWLAKGEDGPEGEELSEEEAERLGREFVLEFLAGCGLSPDLEPLEGEEEGEDVETDQDKAQTVYVPKSIAPTPELASDLVRSLGLDGSTFEDAPGEWVFRQHEPCDCHPGVVCDEQGCRVVRGPICSCHGRKGNLDASIEGKTMTRKADDDERPQDEEERPAEGEGEGEAEEIREKVKLKAGALWLRGLGMYCRACDEEVEHPGVQKLSKRVRRWGKRTAAKYYKDADLGYSEDDDPAPAEGDEDEEDEAPPKKKPRASDEEKAVIDSLEKIMSEVFGRARGKAAGRELTRTTTTNGR